MSYHSPDEITQYLITVAGSDEYAQCLMEMTEKEKSVIDRLIALVNEARENESILLMYISDDPDDINEFLKEHEE